MGLRELTEENRKPKSLNFMVSRKEAECVMEGFLRAGASMGNPLTPLVHRSDLYRKKTSKRDMPGSGVLEFLKDYCCFLLLPRSRRAGVAASPLVLSFMCG